MASLFGACPNATKGDGDDDARRVVEAAKAAAPILDRFAIRDGYFGKQAPDEVLELIEAVRALAALNAGASHG